MSCKESTKNNSCTDVLSTDCIRWEGDKYEDLDICINDSLTEVETKIINEIIEIMKGKGIIITKIDFSDCDYIKSIIGVKEKSLFNILNSYKIAVCQLKEILDIIKSDQDNFTTISNYALSCLGLTTSVCEPEIKFKTLIQAIITKLCDVDTKYNGIATLILQAVESTTGDFMCDVIKSCGNNGIIYSGSGSNTRITFQALVPPFCPIIYTGSMSVFDISGIGNANTYACGWYICNGDNGTPTSASLPQNIAEDIVYIMRLN